MGLIINLNNQKKMTEEQQQKVEIQKKYLKILQDVWVSALSNTVLLSLSRLPKKEEDNGDWEQFQKTLSKLPSKLELGSGEKLRNQFKEMGLHPDEIENLKLGLWEYFEEHDIDVSDFSDDGMDEAEMEKDVIPFIIETILGFEQEVTHPSFLAYNWVKADLLNDYTPPIWIDQVDLKDLVDAMKRASELKGSHWNNPYYSKAVQLWIEDLSK